MYESFFGFREKPFSLAPDASFFFLSEKHDLALTQLQYALQSQALITVITGEIGCGKTTLLQKIIGESEDDITIGLLNYTHSSFGDLLNWVLLAFDLDHKLKSKVDRYKSLVQFFVSEYANNRRTMLIVDEAQNMDDDTLEELRMLSNINVDKDQVLQLVLVGQPELRERLRRPNLYQFAQRIAVDYHIDALGLAETADYIKHRLEIAGGDPRIFLSETYELVYRHSRGVPRLINIVCDTALLYAYASQQKVVDAALIGEAIKDREKSAYFGNILSSSTEDTALATTADYEQLTDDTKSEPPNLQKQHSAGTLATDGQRVAQPDASEMLQELAAIAAEREIGNEPTHDPSESTPRSLVDERPVSQEVNFSEITVADPESSITAASDEFQPVWPIPRELEETIEPPTRITSTPDKPQRLRRVAPLLAVLFLAVLAGLYMFPELIPVPPAVSPEAESGEELAIEPAPVLPTNENTTAGSSRVPGFVAESNIGDLQSTSPLVTGDANDGGEAAGVPDQRSADVQIQHWLSQAEQYLARGRLLEPADANAYDSLQKILAYRPDHPEALRRMESIGTRLQAMATEAEEDQRWDQAGAHLRSLLSIRPEHELARDRLTALESAAREREQIRQWLEEAEILIVAGRLVQPEGGNAYEIVRRILELQPQHSAAASALNTIKVKLLDASDRATGDNRLQTAIQHLRDLLTVDPNHAVALSRIETLRAKAAQQEQTRKDLAQAEKQIEMGKLVAPEGDNAFETLRVVLAREPLNSVALEALENIKTMLMDRANIATENDQRDIAITQLNKLLAIEPQHAVAKSLLEELEAEEKKGENILKWLVEAERYLDNGQLTQPEGGNAYEFLNRVLEAQPDNEQALSAIETIKRTLLDRAEQAMAAAQWDLADTHLSTLLTIQPDSPAAQAMLSTVQTRIQSQQQILRWLSQAEQYLRSGNLLDPPGSNAYELLQKVLAEEPAHVQAIELLSQLADLVFELADRAMSEQDYVRARVHLERLSSLDLAGERVRSQLDLLSQAEYTQRRVGELMALARSYIASGRLVKPEKENAYDLLSQVIELQPENPEVLDAITRIEKKLLEEAREARRNQQWNEAKNHLQDLLQLDPDHTVAKIELQEVESTLEQLLRIQDLLLEAQEYVDAGQLTMPPRLNAYETFEQVLQYEPQNPSALAGIDSIKATLLRSAQEAKRQRQFESAKASLRVLLSLQPDHAAALSEVEQIENQLLNEEQISEWLKEAWEHIQAGRLVAPENTNAYQTLQRVVDRQPNNSQALAAIETIKSQLLQAMRQATQQREWEQVQTRSKQLLQVDGDHPAALASLELAQRQISTARKVKQWMSDATRLLGSGQLIKPPGTNAYETLRKVLSREPDHAPALAAIESIIERLLDRAAEQQSAEQWEPAASTLREVLVIKPDNGNALTMLAEIEHHIQTQREIEGWLEKATQYAVSGPTVGPPNANLYELLQKVLERDPDNPRATEAVETIKSELMRSATVAQQRQEWQAASSHLRYLLHIDPENLVLRSNLQTIEERIERERKLTHWLQLAEKNLKAGRLVDPIGDNAYDALRNVLSMEPDHAEAKRGIDSIKTKLWQDAVSAGEQELWEQARQHLENLLLIDPNHPEGVARMSLVTANIQRDEERARRAELAEILSILQHEENSPPTDTGPQTSDPEEILNIITGREN
jgi:type II secretory pathway predicted ATPase ExeA/tetratricopeptide (TPR) repeat protein